MDVQEAAIRARVVITERSEGSVDIALPNIVALIPTALETWARLCFDNREKRELLKRSFEAEAEAGTLDLTPLLDGTDGRINLKELRQTTLYAEDKPLVWVNSYQQLVNMRMLRSESPAGFLEGSVLKVRSASGAAADMTLTFTVTSYPAAVTDIPKELEHDFVLALAAMVAGGAK